MGNIETEGGKILPFPELLKSEKGIMYRELNPEAPAVLSISEFRKQKITSLDEAGLKNNPRLDLLKDWWGTERSGIWKIAEVIGRIIEIIRSKRKRRLRLVSSMNPDVIA